MFEISLVLGVVLLLVGLTALFEGKRFAKTALSIIENDGLLFLLAILNLVFGTLVLTIEYRFSFTLIGLFALMGWLMVLRGILLLWFTPEAVHFAKKALKKGEFMNYAGVLMLILGVAFTYLSYSLV